jgi:hypothetical protein
LIVPTTPLGLVQYFKQPFVARHHYPVYGNSHIPFDTAFLDLTPDPPIREVAALAKVTVWFAV